MINAKLYIAVLSVIMFFSVAELDATEKNLKSPADSIETEYFSIWYRVDSTTIDENYLSNRRQIDRIKHYLKHSTRIDSITIRSWASPEGGFLYNKKLSEGRARSARDFLLSHAGDSSRLDAAKIRIVPVAENWEGLLRLVEDDYMRRDRSKVLDILNDPDIGNETRKWRLEQLDHGWTWRYLIDNYMPGLRAASWICVWTPVPPVLPHVEPMTDVLVHKGPALKTAAPFRQPERREFRRTILALKTNLLYDAASLLNYSVEVPVYKDKASISLYHQFPWWTWGQAENEYCIRFLSVGAEARWWFKPSTDKVPRDRLAGHFLGAYGESGKYDFQWEESFCRQGEFWSAGLSYGYAMPIGKRLNMEFSISAGYASIAFRGYDPSDDYEILWRDPEEVGRVHYFGPTKVRISLVVPITVSTVKGGMR